jgi:competence protein ComEC
MVSQAKKYLTWVIKLASRVPIKWTLFPLLLAAILVWIAAITTPDTKLHVFFLDVGQGDAIMIQTPSHHNILIDGGPSPEAITAALGSRLPFWSRTIDLVVLTHPHDDHITGLVEVLRRYEVKQVLEYNATSIGFHSSAYDEWLKLIEEKGIKRTIARAGQRIELGPGIWLDVLHPPADLLQGTDSDIDNNGMVLRLVYGKISFLFTADIYQEAEQCLLSQGDELESTVLKVAHHGADTSSSLPFLNAVSPQLAIISVGAENRFGHPHPEIMARLTEKLGQDKVYLTKERGDIELISDGHRLWLKTEH